MKVPVVLLIAMLMLAKAAPVAAQSWDPQCFACPALLCAGADWSDDPPLASSLPAGAPNRQANWRLVEAQYLMNAAASAIAAAGPLRFRLDMEMTMTGLSGAAWTSRSTLIGSYVAPNRLQGDLSIVDPWTELRSSVVVAEGKANVTDATTGEWREGLELPTTYYPIIVAGCLLRMAQADMVGLAFSGWTLLEGEPVYRVKSLDGARDRLAIEYQLGAKDGLLRRATAQSNEQPGWSAEAHTLGIAATLTVLGDGR